MTYSTEMTSTETSSPESQFNFQGEFPTLSKLEASYIQYVYQQTNRHQGKAAQILGVSRRTLYRKLKSAQVH